MEATEDALLSRHSMFRYVAANDGRLSTILIAFAVAAAVQGVGEVERMMYILRLILFTDG